MTAAEAKTQFARDGFYITPPSIPQSLLERAIVHMGAVIGGMYETGVPPAPYGTPGKEPTQGSGPNPSPAPRRSFAFHLRTEKSVPMPGSNHYYVSHLKDPRLCPVIYQAGMRYNCG